MRFTAQEEYGLRCIVQVARQGEGESASIVEIAARESLSTAYVAKLLRVLRQGGLLESIRGQQGGYRLARSADTISVAQVLKVLDGKLYSQEFCEKYSGNESNCVHVGDCSLRPLWHGLEQLVYGILEACKLSDLTDDEAGMDRWIASHFQSLSVSSLSSADAASVKSGGPLT